MTYGITTSAAFGDRAFLKSQRPFNKDVLKAFSNTMREEVKTKGPAELRASLATSQKKSAYAMR